MFLSCCGRYWASHTVISCYLLTLSDTKGHFYIHKMQRQLTPCDTHLPGTTNLTRTRLSMWTTLFKYLTEKERKRSRHVTEPRMDYGVSGYILPGLSAYHKGMLSFSCKRKAARHPFLQLGYWDTSGLTWITDLQVRQKGTDLLRRSGLGKEIHIQLESAIS